MQPIKISQANQARYRALGRVAQAANYATRFVILSEVRRRFCIFIRPDFGRMGDARSQGPLFYRRVALPPPQGDLAHAGSTCPMQSSRAILPKIVALHGYLEYA